MSLVLQSTMPKKQWSGALAFSNIGLPGVAFVSDSWRKKHKAKLQALFSNLLMTEEKPQGILLCEVCNFSDPITHEGRERLEDVLEFAFKETGGGEHGPPQILLEQQRNDGSVLRRNPSACLGATYERVSSGQSADSGRDCRWLVSNCCRIARGLAETHCQCNMNNL